MFPVPLEYRSYHPDANCSSALGLLWLIAWAGRAVLVDVIIFAISWWNVDGE